MSDFTRKGRGMAEEEESAMLLGSIYGDLAGLMQEDAPALATARMVHGR